MELCYLWVSAFRGFSNQGFNLSWKSRFHYTQSINLLTTSPDQSHIDNFFGGQVSNVNAVVGKNGAGKSNLLELIQYALNGGNTSISEAFFTVFRLADGSLQGFVHAMRAPEGGVDFLPYSGTTKKVASIYYTQAFDGREYRFHERTIQLTANQILHAPYRANARTMYHKILQAQVYLFDSRVFPILQAVESKIGGTSKPIPRPTHIIFQAPSWQSLLSKARAFDKRFFGPEALQDSQSLHAFVRTFRKKTTGRSSANSFWYFTAFLMVMDFFFNKYLPVIVNSHNSGEKTELLDKASTNTSLADTFLGGVAGKRIDDIFDFITNSFSRYLENMRTETRDFAVFLREMSSRFTLESTQRYSGVYKHRSVEFRMPFTKDAAKFAGEYLDNTYDQNLTYNIDWPGISSGHKAYLNLFGRFLSVVRSVRQSHVIICIDEGELYFHPKWQLEFVYKLTRVLPEIFHGKTVQLILSTHSPFIVSDMPKSNVIFLNQTDHGEQHVVAHSQVDTETFGGNIMELYLDAFYLQGNSISHFAVEKLKDVVELLQEGNLSGPQRTYVEQIIAITGDVLISGKLTKMLGND